MQGIIQLDVHNKNQYQTRTALDALLRRADNSLYRIRVIHGCNNGTVLRDLLVEEYSKHPKILRLQHYPNKGQTDLILREL